MNSKRREAEILSRTRAKYAREFEDLFYAEGGGKDEGGGRWITIGANASKDGGPKKGGARVYVKDGKIEKGPGKMIGNSPGNPLGGQAGKRAGELDFGKEWKSEVKADEKKRRKEKKDAKETKKEKAAEEKAKEREAAKKQNRYDRQNRKDAERVQREHRQKKEQAKQGRMKASQEAQKDKPKGKKDTTSDDETGARLALAFKGGSGDPRLSKAIGAFRVHRDEGDVSDMLSKIAAGDASAVRWSLARMARDATADRDVPGASEFLSKVRALQVFVGSYHQPEEPKDKPKDKPKDDIDAKQAAGRGQR